LCGQVYGILKDRQADSANWMWKSPEIPLEFTHGAFRVGHAMVRSFYQVNSANKFTIGDILGGPVVGEVDRDPLPSTWIVEWQRFFKFANKAEPNYALKLAIHQQLPVDFVGDFQPVAPDSPDRLLMRDWLSAANARMIKLDALIRTVKAQKDYAGLTPMDTAEITQWLTDLVNNSLGTDEAKDKVRQEIPRLTTDLPLPLYILLEAEKKMAGAGLGPMGSIIVGETIFRCLTAAEQQLMPLLPSAQQALGTADWRRIDQVDCMTQLIELAEDWGELKDCPQIPFIAPGP
jgi:hypothetical protein